MEDEEVDKSGPSSYVSNYPSEESTTFNEDDFVTLEASYKSILDELIEDAMWDVCFEVHYAAKHGILLLDDPEKRKHPIVDDSERDIFGQTLKSKVQNFQITCPICKNRSCATKYASHLAKCIGISGRNSSRAATKRIAATNVFSDDEDEWNSDSSFNGNKKKRKKGQGKKNNRKRSGKGQGNSISKSSSETNADYQEMTYEERKAFFNQMCGVISKRSNKMCMNTHKCSQHSDEQRRDVRHILLRDMGDQITNDGQIDVDTVDEGMGGLSFLMQSLPAAHDKYMSSMSGFNEKKSSTSKISAAGFKKKKEGFSPVTSVSSPGEIAASGSSFDSV